MYHTILKTMCNVLFFIYHDLYFATILGQLAFFPISDMAVEEIESEVEQLRHQINGLKGRCSLVTETVTHLESKYEQSKNFAPPRRYDLMKRMIQKVINDQFI